MIPALIIAAAFTLNVTLLWAVSLTNAMSNWVCLGLGLATSLLFALMLFYHSPWDVHGRALVKC
jgi:hypothetical protein